MSILSSSVGRGLSMLVRHVEGSARLIELIEALGVSMFSSNVGWGPSIFSVRLVQVGARLIELFEALDMSMVSSNVGWGPSIFSVRIVQVGARLIEHTDALEQFDAPDMEDDQMLKD